MGFGGKSSRRSDSYLNSYVDFGRPLRENEKNFKMSINVNIIG